MPMLPMCPTPPESTAEMATALLSRSTTRARPLERRLRRPLISLRKAPRRLRRRQRRRPKSWVIRLRMALRIFRRRLKRRVKKSRRRLKMLLRMSRSPSLMLRRRLSLRPRSLETRPRMLNRRLKVILKRPLRMLRPLLAPLTCRLRSFLLRLLS
jgi:hypothetical protein